jgi:hypothetical protein
MYVCVSVCVCARARVKNVFLFALGVIITPGWAHFAVGTFRVLNLLSSLLGDKKKRLV